ncbi:uncharacterized protein LAJ45_10169 [Morchella importuna]|uniref:uncharacterized protein n=1 Tax=Morchella importuna TaxID=1174673 RepID=UPI001E8DA789|nr:uncharacterized protein LAJ45_10169 [Morchella importuna]KAH8145844.1 hypothetical protein LAJ45_10169 [Morchella importuna]
MAESSHPNKFRSSFGPMPAVPIIQSACSSDPDYPIPQALGHAGEFEIPPGPSDASAATENYNRFLLLTIYTGHRLHSAQQYHIIVKRSLPANAGNTCAKDLFMAIRHAYDYKLRRFWQRYLSLRCLKYIGLLEVVFRVVSGFCEYAFHNPPKLKTTDTWVNWVFALKNSPPRRYGLEFVQGGDEEKIMILGAVTWVSSVLTAIIWGILGDVQSAIAVASYLLTASGSLLALLAIVSKLEGSIDTIGDTGMKVGLNTVSSPRPPTPD